MYCKRRGHVSCKQSQYRVVSVLQEKGLCLVQKVSVPQEKGLCLVQTESVQSSLWRDEDLSHALPGHRYCGRGDRWRAVETAPRI